MDKTPNAFEKRLAAYATTAGIAVAITPASIGQVIYTDVEPDVCFNAATHFIDLDANGANDFRLTHGWSFAPLDSGTNCHTFTCWGDIDGNFPENRFMALASGHYAQDLSSGASISSLQNFDNDTGYSVRALFSYGFGPWHGGNDAFVGLRFIADRNGVPTRHYGWARVSTSKDVNSICLHEYAYGATPDTPIHAGDRGADTSISCSFAGPPIVVNSDGGSFDYDLEIFNSLATAVDVDIWIDIEGPGVERRRGPITRTIGAGGSLLHTVHQRIPAGAPAGVYINTCQVGTHPDAVANSSFEFEKSAATSSTRTAVAEWSPETEIFEVPSNQTSEDAPTGTGLVTNYPNPFNPSTTIRFSLPEAARVRLGVFDVLGRQVRLLQDGVLEAGPHSVVFEAGDLPSGTYLYRLETPQGSFVESMLLTK